MYSNKLAGNLVSALQMFYEESMFLVCCVTCWLRTEHVDVCPSLCHRFSIAGAGISLATVMIRTVLCEQVPMLHAEEPLQLLDVMVQLMVPL